MEQSIDIDRLVHDFFERVCGARLDEQECEDMQCKTCYPGMCRELKAEVRKLISTNETQRQLLHVRFLDGIPAASSPTVQTIYGCPLSEIEERIVKYPELLRERNGLLANRMIEDASAHRIMYPVVSSDGIRIVTAVVRLEVSDVEAHETKPGG